MMRETAIRTSLQWLPDLSGASVGREELRDLHRRFWLLESGVVLKLADPDLIGMHRLMIQGIAKVRFGL